MGIRIGAVPLAEEAVNSDAKLLQPDRYSGLCRSSGDGLRLPIKLIPNLVIYVPHLRINTEIARQMVGLHEFDGVGIILHPFDAATHVSGQLGRDQSFKR